MGIRGRGKKQLQSNPPSLSLDEAQHAWLTLAGVAYAVETCTVQQFRTFVRQCAPSGWKDWDAKALLKQRSLDMLDRWYVLCALCQVKASVILYPSREAAEQAIVDAAQARSIA